MLMEITLLLHFKVFLMAIMMLSSYCKRVKSRNATSVSKQMEAALAFFERNFEQSIAYIKKGYFRDKTNNDVERMMRKIKRTQQTHYFLRDNNNYIRKLSVVLGFRIPIAA